MTVRTGIAGWVFEPWRGVFYPDGLVQKKELAYAASRLASIEINATFRANQKPDSFARWAGETPDGFVFSIKGPQLVTHIKRLRNCEVELANFFASGPLALGNRLGPFVWQLPPNLTFDAKVLAGFVKLLPRTVEDYVALAGKADGRLKTPPFLETGNVGPIRHAIEVRNASFAVPEAFDLLAASNVALVIADTIEQPERALTADFAYCRLQGPARAEAGGYGPGEIADWAGQIRTWDSEGRDVFAYFVHEDKLHAPDNAMALAAALGVAPKQD